MADPTVSANPTLAKAQSTFSTPKTASSKDARRVFGKSMSDITAAVDAARGLKAGEGTATPSEGMAAAATEEVAPEAGTTEAATPAPVVAEPAADPLRAREAKLVEKQQAFARKEREFEARMARVENELAQAREIERLSKSDPFAYFEKYHGIKPDAFVEALGAQAQQRRGGQAAAATVIPPEVARELEDGRQFRQRFEAEQRQRRIADEQENFARSAKEGASRWPIAARVSAERLKQRGWEIAVSYANQGQSLTNEEILDKLEDELAEYTSAAKPTGTKQVTKAAVAESGTNDSREDGVPTHPLCPGHFRAQPACETLRAPL